MTVELIAIEIEPVTNVMRLRSHLKMKKTKSVLAAFFAIGLAVSLTACSNPEGFNRYRYPCQDPVNWEKAECNPPVCEATGTCTKDILGTAPTDGTTVESDTP
jgi:hypothetical protein